MTEYIIGRYTHVVKAEIETASDYGEDSEPVITTNLSKEGLLKCLGMLKESDSIDGLVDEDNEIRVRLKNQQEYSIVIEQGYETKRVIVDGNSKLVQKITMTSDLSSWNEDTSAVFFAGDEGIVSGYDSGLMDLASSIYWYAEGHKQSKFNPQSWRMSE